MKAVNYKYKFFVCTLSIVAGVSFAKGDSLRAGRDAFMNYDFDSAASYYDKYANSLKKSPNIPGEELLDKYMRQLDIAENSLENVQIIEIIERLDVPAEEFFKYIKLPYSGGKLVSPDASVLINRHNQSDFAFSSESGDLMMWSENDGNLKEVILQSERLMDGSWEKPENVGEVLNDGGNARNPFLLSDGLTLYFSSDGDGSMGGYDLFVATKDAASGKFRQPIGLGYPFNSPYNEYMMAVDEDNGIGWWVTDRNRLDGQVSIYVFKTNEVRKNYVMDEEDDIISLARIDDISVTQNPDTDYQAIIKQIDIRSAPVNKASGSDFLFPLSEGRVARKLSDFTSAAARRDMQQYLETVNDHEQLESKLAGLRKEYHKTKRNSGNSASIRNRILDIESKYERQTEQLKKMRNTIISTESKK